MNAWMLLQYVTLAFSKTCSSVQFLGVCFQITKLSKHEEQAVKQIICMYHQAAASEHSMLISYLLLHGYWYPCDIVLQNPLVTMMWVGILNSTLLPTVNFAIDTYGFCQKYSWAEVALFSVYSIFCMLCCMLSPAWFDVLDVFQFYALPFSFGWKLYLLGVAGMMGYWTVQILGVTWARSRQRRRLRPTNALLWLASVITAMPISCKSQMSGLQSEHSRVFEFQ